MAREIRVETYCDPCLAQDEREFGVEVTIGASDVGRGEPRTLALCQVHAKEWEAVREWLETLGQKPGAEVASPKAGARSKHTRAAAIAETGGAVCPRCGFVSANRHALMTHTRARHGETLAVIEGGVDAGFKCPECGWLAANPQGLGAHRRAQHGVKGTSKSVTEKDKAKAARADADEA